MSDLPEQEFNSRASVPVASATGIDSDDVVPDDVPPLEREPARGEMAIAIGWIAVLAGFFSFLCGTSEGWLSADAWTFVGLLGGGAVSFVVAILAIIGKRYMQAFGLFLASAMLLALPVLIGFAIGRAYSSH